MKLAARAGRIVPSPTLGITATAKAMAAQGIDVIDFASGDHRAAPAIIAPR